MILLLPLHTNIVMICCVLIVQGPYREFSGHDASLCLATMAVKYNGCDLTGLSDEALGILDEWDNKFRSKYPIVGIINDSSEPNSSQWYGPNKTHNNTQNA